LLFFNSYFTIGRDFNDLFHFSTPKRKRNARNCPKVVGQFDDSPSEPGITLLLGVSPG
jgi:hypothetical protein